MNKLPSSLKSFIFGKLSNITSYGILIFDEKFSIIYWSKSAVRITGYYQADILGKELEEITIVELFSNKNKEISLKNFLEDLLKDGKSKSRIIYIRHKSNYRFSIIIKFILFKEKKKNKKFIIGIFSIFDALDYTRKKVNTIKKISNQDHLTMLPNRRSLEDLINKKIKEFKKSNSKFGIILFDINNFKSINDCFGHNSGDNILKDFSKTISKSLRSCDVLGRWGGDEFVALILNVDEKKIEKIMKKLTKIIKNRIFKVKGYELKLTISAGSSIIQEKDNLITLIDRADKNMYKEKLKRA